MINPTNHALVVGVTRDLHRLPTITIPVFLKKNAKQLKKKRHSPRIGSACPEAVVEPGQKKTWS